MLYGFHLVTAFQFSFLVRRNHEAHNHSHSHRVSRIHNLLSRTLPRQRRGDANMSGECNVSNQSNFTRHIAQLTGSQAGKREVVVASKDSIDKSVA